MTNQKFKSAITFCRSNENGNYLNAKNYLAKQIRFVFPAHQQNQQNNCYRNKRNVYHVKKDKFGKTKLCNIVYISNTTRLFSSEEWRKIRNNPGVLKMIQDCPGRNNKAEDHKMRKGGKRNGTRNNSNMNNKITQAAISELHTCHIDDNSILAHVQMPSMGR